MTELSPAAQVVLANGRPVLGGNSGSEVRLSMVCRPAARRLPAHTCRLKFRICPQPNRCT